MSTWMKGLSVLILCAVFALVCAGCLDGSEDPTPSSGGTAASVPTTAALAQPDPDVSDVLRSFYQNDLPSMALRCGVKDAQGEEIRCTISMLRKTVFADFDADGQKEIILLYDIAELSDNGTANVAVFLDEMDGKPMVVSVEPGTYGASKNGESYILTRYNDSVCKARFIQKDAYEAVLVDVFQNGAWRTSISAYRHISDHGGVRLENDSCYIDHGGSDLYKAAVTGELSFSKEKFLNFRTPNDNYNNLITALLAETMLP